MPMAGKQEILKAIYPNCWICRLPFADLPKLRRTKDHYLPKSKGGGNELDNLRYAHRFCNQQRGNRLGNPSDGFRRNCRAHIQKLLNKLARWAQIAESARATDRSAAQPESAH